MANICSFPRWQGGGRYTLCVCLCICSFLNWYTCTFHFLWKSSWLITAVSFCPDFKALVKAHSPAFAICLIKCICHLPNPQGAVKGPAWAQLLGTHHQQGKAARGYRTGRALQPRVGSEPALGGYDYNFIFPVTKGASLSHSKDVNTEIQCQWKVSITARVEQREALSWSESFSYAARVFLEWKSKQRNKHTKGRCHHLCPKRDIVISPIWTHRSTS